MNLESITKIREGVFSVHLDCWFVFNQKGELVTDRRNRPLFNQHQKIAQQFADHSPGRHIRKIPTAYLEYDFSD